MTWTSATSEVVDKGLTVGIGDDRIVSADVVEDIALVGVICEMVADEVTAKLDVESVDVIAKPLVDVLDVVETVVVVLDVVLVELPSVILDVLLVE